MNTISIVRISLLLLVALAFCDRAHAQGSLFSFNGRLVTDTGPATGLFDMRFSLFPTEVGGVAVAGPLAFEDVPVTNGLFTVALDYGSAVFDGNQRWLGIEVRPGESVGAYTVLSPRLQIMSSPYAIRAAVATTVSGNAGFRVEPNAISPNIVGGHSGNAVAPTVVGGTISGGGRAGQINQVTTNFGTIGGGAGNTVSGAIGTIGGGSNNTITATGPYAVIAGGFANHAADFASVVSGGFNNTNDTFAGTIGGGERNLLRATFYATIGGGAINRIQVGADQATIAGGTGNTVDGGSAWGAIGGGVGNHIQTNADYSTISGGRLNHVQTNATHSVVSGGESNVMGGWNHFLGTPNPPATHMVIGGGKGNRVQRDYSVIGGGVNNTNFNAGSVIAGGELNYMTGVAYQDSGTNCCEGGWNTISGGYKNLVRNYLSSPFGSAGTIGGGYSNTVHGFAGTVPGGEGNFAGPYAFAAGRRAFAQFGSFTWADSTDAPFSSTRGDQFAVRAGGGMRIDSSRGISLNAANRPLITREWDPFTSGIYDDLGRWGLFMEASALTAGIPAIAGRVFRVSSYNANSTINTHLMTVDQGGTVTATAFNPTSDRNAKTNFAPVNAGQILERVLGLPIQTWTFKSDESKTRHIGPMAQDFHTRFNVGTDEKHIATVDADGVALAAIQGLNEKVEDRNQKLQKELRARDKEIAELKQRLEKLEQVISSR